MINRILKIVFFSLIFLFSVNEGNSTHMVGGDFTYRCLGNGYFEITLTIRRDCYFGADDAEFDEKAIIAIFDQYNGPLKPNQGGILHLKYQGNDTLSESLNVECGMLGDLVCVHEAIYRDTIRLPRPQKGRVHRLYYQRCCRNQSLLNVESPLETGNSYMIEIDENAFLECNNSPVFNKWPDIYICANEPLNFDHSATDIDGDSLVYKLYTPFLGGTITKPKPEVHADFVPYLDKRINWANGFSEDNMFGSSDPLVIDPVTGIITGTPQEVGQYVVGVKVEEYRNGKLLSIVRRDFEYNVRTCIDGPEAVIESVDAICGSALNDTLYLGNESKFADSYEWTVYQFSTGQTFTYSDFDFNFIYTLPAIGKDTFDVTLSAYSELAKCSDEVTKRIIAVKDELIADFDLKINDCFTDSLEITLDLSDKFDALNPLYTWKSSKWTIMFDHDTIVVIGNIISVTVPKEDFATILLEIDTEEKCQASIEKVVPLDPANIRFVSDTLIVCKGEHVNIVANPHSSWTYTWEPETGLDFGSDPNDKSNPLFTLEQDMKYNVTVTDGVCTDFGVIQIYVKDYFDISIEGPDTVCIDEVNLKAIGDGDPLLVFEWSNTSTFDNILEEGENVTLHLNQRVNKFYLRVKEGTGCSNNIDSITVYNGFIDLEYSDIVLYCTGYDSEVILNGKLNGVSFLWDDNPIIKSGKNSNVLIINTDNVGEYDLVFHASTSYGCNLTDTIHVVASEGPDGLEITANLECGTHTVCFGTTSNEDNLVLSNFNWSFGDPTTDTDVSDLPEPCYTYPEPGTYQDTLRVKVESCGGTVLLYKEVVVSEIIDISIETEPIYCPGNEVTLISTTTAGTDKVEWFSSSTSLGVGDTIIINPVGDMDVFAVAYDAYGCTDTAFLSLEEYVFDITFIDPGVRCKYDTLQLEVVINNGSALEFEWLGDNIVSGGNTNKPTVFVTEDTEFKVIITDPGICDSTFIFSVDVSDLNIDAVADTTELVITNSTNITVLNVPDGSTIEWSTGETNKETISITPTAGDVGTKTYCVTVTDEYSCLDTACVEIAVIDPACDETDIFIPNAFSPNNDSNNDVFRVRGRYLRNVDILIFDRWGELILKESGDEFINWDGTFRGKDLPPDSYIYKIHVQCEDSDNYTKTGNINLIK